MKKIVFSIICLLIALSLVAQEPVQKSKAERKAERKELKKKMEKELALTTEQAIMTNHFVLKASQLRNKYGHVIMVSPTINFVAVKGDKVYVQFGTESGIGYNGVGGITFKGTLTDCRLTRDKKTNGYSLQLTSQGTTGTLTIFLKSNVTGTDATARVETNWGGQLNFRGEIVPIVGSHIYKGMESN